MLSPILAVAPGVGVLFLLCQLSYLDMFSSSVHQIIAHQRLRVPFSNDTFPRNNAVFVVVTLLMNAASGH